MDPASARRGMQKVGNREPALLAYVLAASSKARRPVHELAVYLFYVVQQMFESVTNGRVEQVTPEAVERHASRNETLFFDLQKTHPRMLQRVGQVEVSRQPHVMRYLVDALFEESHADSEIALTDDESGLLFLVLKTAVDALDEVSGGERGEPA